MPHDERSKDDISSCQVNRLMSQDSMRSCNRFMKSDEKTNVETLKFPNVKEKEPIATHHEDHGDTGDREYLRFLVDLAVADGRGESRRLDLRLFLL